MRLLNSFTFRHCSGVVFATLLALLITHYFSYSGEYWLVLSAFLVSQTTRGTPLRQGLIYFLLIIFAILFSSLLMFINQPIIQLTLLGIIFIGLSYAAYALRLQAMRMASYFRIFSILFIIATLAPKLPETVIQYRIMDTVLGTLLGLIASQWIFPAKFEQEFREGIMPVLNYLIACGEAFSKNLQEKTVKLPRHNLYKQFPNWIYEVGFNPGLRAGFRFFLINLERIADLFFSLNYLFSRKIDKAEWQPLSNKLIQVMQKNTELLRVLLNYFNDKKTVIPTIDFIVDIKELEANLQEFAPHNIELLDFSPDYITLIAIVKDVKDMRQLLLQLISALPENKPT